MSARRAALGLTALAAMLAVALPGGAARADEATKSKAIALFDEGQKDMKAGDYDKACKAFEASNRLLPDSGTRGSLARCYTQLGKLASAWAVWRELADTAPTAALRSAAATQARKLEPRLARYTVKVAAAAPGLAVTVAGQPVDLSIDVPAPIDPGSYPVEATAPGRVTWKGKLTATEGETAEVAVPALAAMGPAKPDGRDRGARGEHQDVHKQGERPAGPAVAGRPGRGRRIFGLTLVGLGAGGLATGAVFGVIASSRNEDARQICGGDIDACEPGQTGPAQAKIDDARAAAKISTIAFAAGGAVAAAGLILYITAPKGERRAVSLAPLVDGTSAGLAISGRY